MRKAVMKASSSRPAPKQVANTCSRTSPGCGSRTRRDADDAGAAREPVGVRLRSRALTAHPRSAGRYARGAGRAATRSATTRVVRTTGDARTSRAHGVAARGASMLRAFARRHGSDARVASGDALHRDDTAPRAA